MRSTFRCFFNILNLKKSYSRYLSVSSVNMKVFTQKTNPLTGTIEWDIQDEDYDFHQEIARSAFADMLHDTERNQKYYQALKIAIDKMHKAGKKANVLDIGTGTGLLSIMAAQCGADTITACEAFKPMAECAQKILERNNVADKITIIPKRSTDIMVGEGGDMKERANILVTEVFDTELIGEGALGTFTHAHKHLLEEGCIVVPDSAVIYAQVVECPNLQKWNKVNDLADDDLKVVLRTPQRLKSCGGSAAVHDVQLSQLPRHSFRNLSEIIPVFHYDWSGKAPLDFNRLVRKSVRAIDNGKAQMVFMWWDLNMDTEKKIILSCAPWWAHPDTNTSSQYPEDTIPWRDHWMQAVYYFPQELTVKKDKELTLISCHDEYSLWFYLEDENFKISDFNRPICECGLHMMFSRTHVSCLNDGRRSKKFLNEIQEDINENAVILNLNGASLLGLAAAKIGAKKVIYLESNRILIDILKDYMRENEIDNVEFLNEINNLNEITHVIAEPTFTNAILPWDNLRLAYFLYKHKLDLDSNVKVMPQSCEFWAMPVEFLDLHKIRQPLDSCEGIDMKIFDDLVESSRNISDDELEAQPLWEYPCYCRGVPHKLFNIGLQSLEPTYCNEGKLHFDESQEGKIVNGFAVWAVWNLSTRSINCGPLISPELNQRVTWDPHTRQAVKILKRNHDTSKGDSWTFSIKCDLNQGSFNLKLELQ